MAALPRPSSHVFPILICHAPQSVSCALQDRNIVGWHVISPTTLQSLFPDQNRETTRRPPVARRWSLPKTRIVAEARTRPAAGPAPQPGPTISDRFSRAARYHSIWMGRGAHHVRRHLKRIRTPQAVHGLVGSLRSRWWPNSAAEGEQGSRKRLRLPTAFARRSEGPATAEGAEGPVKKHSTHRLAWDFAVITAGAAVLLVLHHHFKRPLHAATTQAVASLDPVTDGTPKKTHRRRRSHALSPAVAVAEHPVDSVRDSGPALSHSDAAASIPQQGEPAPSQNNNAPLDTVKRDDWSSSASASQPPSTSAVAGNAEPPQGGPSDNKLDPPKDAGPALAGDDHGAVSSPAPAGDSTATPPKHRRRHHSPDPAVASAGDSSIPNFNDAPAGPSDSSHKTDAPPLSGPPAADKTPLTAAPGPSLGGSDDHGPTLPPKNEPLLTSQTTTPGPADAGKKNDLAHPRDPSRRAGEGRLAGTEGGAFRRETGRSPIGAGRLRRPPGSPAKNTI